MQQNHSLAMQHFTLHLSNFFTLWLTNLPPIHSVGVSWWASRKLKQWLSTVAQISLKFCLVVQQWTWTWNVHTWVVLSVVMAVWLAGKVPCTQYARPLFWAHYCVAQRHGPSMCNLCIASTLSHCHCVCSILGITRSQQWLECLWSEHLVKQFWNGGRK